MKRVFIVKVIDSIKNVVCQGTSNLSKNLVKRFNFMILHARTQAEERAHESESSLLDTKDLLKAATEVTIYHFSFL